MARGDGAGRPLGRRHQEDVRNKIQASTIIQKFMSAFEGKSDLTQVQVNIGKTLLDKALPDLKALEHTGAFEHTHNHLVNFDDSIAELLKRVRG